MRSVLAIALAAFAFMHVSAADEFDDRLKQGFGHLRAGDVDAAVDIFRDLQTEAPDSDLIKYSLAASKYRQALKDLENNLPEEAVSQLEEARTNLNALAASPDPFVSQNAAYVAANCDAQLAKQLAAAGNHKQTLEAFRGAIEGYEDVLRHSPDHAGARQNREHMRYLLKKMLQNPPPPQQQQGEGDEKEEEQEGDQQQQQQQPGEQGDEEKQQEQQNQQQQQGEQEQQDEGDQQEQEPSPDDQEPEDEGEEDQQQQPQPQDAREELQEQTGAPGDQQETQAEASDATQEALNRQNIEAILQSLEDLAREEQKNLRRAKRPPQISGGKWW